MSLDGAPSAPIRYAYAPRRPRAVHAPSTQCSACGCLTRRASVMTYEAELSGAERGAFCGSGTTRPSFCESSPTGFRQRQPPPPFPSTRSLLLSTGSHSAPLRFGRGEPRHICTGTAPAQGIAKPSVLPESDMGLLVCSCVFLFVCVFVCLLAFKQGGGVMTVLGENFGAEVRVAARNVHDTVSHMTRYPAAARYATAAQYLTTARYPSRCCALTWFLPPPPPAQALRGAGSGSHVACSHGRRGARWRSR